MLYYERQRKGCNDIFDNIKRSNLIKDYIDNIDYNNLETTIIFEKYTRSMLSIKKQMNMVNDVLYNYQIDLLDELLLKIKLFRGI